MAEKMKSKAWTASAPSNIALIKYMGKTDSAKNRPTNTSLSYTLNHLNSIVELTPVDGNADRWEPLREYGAKKLAAISLSEKGLAKFLGHLDRLKKHFGCQGGFLIRSANDFPSDCGLASSASSFAALTRVGIEALSERTVQEVPSVDEASALSRQGSGSSCRSFYSPWSIWDSEGARALDLGCNDLVHQVVVVNEEIKAVSSSIAHERVTSSLLFAGRPERAESRVQNLIEALRKEDWAQAFEITWAEFWDMHALFETSRPSFGYMTAGSLEVLRWVRLESWEKTNDGPLVTMDAGPNVHLLHRKTASGQAFAQAVQAKFKGRYQVISSFDHEGRST